MSVPYWPGDVSSSGGGGSYSAGSNISIDSSNVISVVSNPTFSNINTTNINGQPYSGGGGGGSYTAGSNITITSNTIAVSTNPSFSNINVLNVNNQSYFNPTFSNVNLTSINSQPYVAGYTKSIIPLNTVAFPAPSYTVNLPGGAGYVNLSLPFNLTIDRYYRISIPSIWAENSATNNDTKSEGIIVSLQYQNIGNGYPSAWFGMIPWDTNMPFSFSLTFKAQDTSAAIKLINNGTTSSDIHWTASNTNVMVLEDLGTIP